MRKSFIILGVLIGSISQANDSMELQLDNLVKAAEIKYALPTGLLAAVIKVESAGNHKAHNKDDGTLGQKGKGMKIPSYGLMQMQLASARFVQKLKASQSGTRLRANDLINPKQLMIPETNVEYGAAYMKWLLNKSNGNVALAVTCYNAGPNSSFCKNKKYYGEYVGKILNAMIEQ